jgi:class 3 adenylate cyclase
VAPSSNARALATILFVDIVRSTEKAARLGDSRWTQVMNHYYAAVRKELKTLRGKEVVTTGDGLLATFERRRPGSVARLQCARPCAHWGWRSGWGCMRANTK